MNILLKDGTQYALEEADKLQFSRYYPSVNIDDELRDMAAWCFANPDRRKTRRGMMRFIGNWLKKESGNEKGRRANTGRSDSIRGATFDPRF